MRYDRTLAIAKRHESLLALVGQGTYSSSLLAEKLNVSEQTVYRDILCLKRQGHGIRSVRLSKGWAYQLASNGGPSKQRKGRRAK
jgi:DeoR/GlpR family transcriptional regulator of sugar metabolism